MSEPLSFSVPAPGPTLDERIAKLERAVSTLARRLEVPPAPAPVVNPYAPVQQMQAPGTSALGLLREILQIKNLMREDLVTDMTLGNRLGAGEGAEENTDLASLIGLFKAGKEGAGAAPQTATWAPEPAPKTVSTGAGKVDELEEPPA